MKAKDSLRSRLGWRYEEVWSQLNRWNLSKVHAEDFKLLLKEHGVFLSPAELDRLSERF